MGLGYIELIKGLNEETNKSATGIIKAGALHNLGAVYYLQGRYDDAVKMYQKSMKIKEKLGDRGGIALSEWGIGIIYAGRGRYDDAIEKYGKCLEIFNDLGDKKNIAGILHRLE